ncbi:MAG: hypothetical protein NTZ04_04180 [Chloroflexi bacterium]|nr:hypothetical protein [Chloroflexota bacterium]
MARGIFTDKEHRPTMDEIFAAIGPSRPLWEVLARFVVSQVNFPPPVHVL